MTKTRYSVIACSTLFANAVECVWCDARLDENANMRKSSQNGLENVFAARHV